MMFMLLYSLIEGGIYLYLARLIKFDQLKCLNAKSHQPSSWSLACLAFLYLAEYDMCLRLFFYICIYTTRFGSDMERFEDFPGDEF